jgi:hypothetical protein
MEYKSVQQLAAVARVNPDSPAAPALSGLERLERWAELLEQDPTRQLSTLFETEYQLVGVRETMRASASPISVAANDPLLRAEGLAGDTYGDARRFFALSDHELHNVLCYCHYGATVQAGTAARAVRSVIASRTRPGLVERVRTLFAS